MALLLDTNIIIELVRDDTPNLQVRKLVNPSNLQLFTSFVCVAEAYSFAVQSGWGKNKIAKLESILQDLYVMDIKNDETLQAYIDIDTYSQGKNPTSKLVGSAKNMGKNDIWIASTASVLSMELVTTDADFDHLNNTFLIVKKITPQSIQKARK